MLKVCHGSVSSFLFYFQSIYSIDLTQTRQPLFNGYDLKISEVNILLLTLFTFHINDLVMLIMKNKKQLKRYRVKAAPVRADQTGAF